MSNNMDNFEFNIRGRTKETFALAMRIAFDDLEDTEKTTAKYWFQTKYHGLVLLWADDKYKKTTPFPGPMNVNTAIEFCWNWLENANREEFELEKMDAYYDGDGSSKPAFRVFCEEWGHVDECQFAICAILPTWAWIGK